MALLGEGQDLADALQQYELIREGDFLTLQVRGAWTLETAREYDRKLRDLANEAAAKLQIDGSGITVLDSAGAWVLRRTLEAHSNRGADAIFAGIRDEHRSLLEKAFVPNPDEEVEPQSHGALITVLNRCGKAVVEASGQAKELIGFFGLTLVYLVRLILAPRRIRFISFVNQLEQVGVNAIPIVALLCFLVGVVLAYMGAQQLAQFGADILTVDLVSVSVLREIGVLLTAIIIAGRSGSAFTAQIGSMKVNQEVDALETMGLSPVDVLVMPRMIALIIALPLLTIVGDLAGLFGGLLIVMFKLGLNWSQFLTQLSGAIDLWDFWTGLIKAPVFAIVISVVGCFEGLKVKGSAESVGQLTTKSVVESIFIVIVLNAVFAVFYAELGI